MFAKLVMIRLLFSRTVMRLFVFKVLPVILIILGLYQTTILTGTHRHARRPLIKGCDQFCTFLLVEEYKAQNKLLIEQGRAAEYEDVVVSLNKKLGR
ncbi:MAG: hypothetical protein GY718_09520 [Lentisphaerae bacterium]|nr:hypothetical protein [Lentisphaerota bacterium]